LNSLIISIVSFALAQTKNQFADDEGKRLFELLTGMDCIDNPKCAPFNDFTPETACDFQPDYMTCNYKGLLETL
jgi:hypothetical protein